MPLTPSLDLALTMIPGPAHNLVLALVERSTGRPVPAVELSALNATEDTPAGERQRTLVTVSLFADLIPPGMIPSPAAPAQA